MDKKLCEVIIIISDNDADLNYLGVYSKDMAKFT